MNWPQLQLIEMGRRNNCEMSYSGCVQPDYYLVMTGPPPSSLTSRGGQRPWLLHSVFLFASQQLLAELGQRGVKVSVATSVRKATWEAAMIYPHSANPACTLSERQRQQLALFA